jgi:hypothetical protein
MLIILLLTVITFSISMTLSHYMLMRKLFHDIELKSRLNEHIFGITFGCCILFFEMFLLEILEIDTPTTRSLFWKFCLYSLDIIVFYLLPFAYIRGKFESRSAKNLILIIFLLGLFVIFIIVQVASYVNEDKTENGYIYTMILLLISVPMQTKFLINLGVVLTAVLQGFAGANLFFCHLFDPFFGIELIDEELDFNISRVPREKRVQNLQSILAMIIKEKRKLQKLRNKHRKALEKKSNSFF